MLLLNLGWEGEKSFQVEADLIATGRTCIIGATGSGKSYAVGVFCEELCKNNVPFTLIDVEGEFSGLKEKYELIWVSEDRECDLNWNELDIEELARQAPDIPPLIIDISETDEPRMKISKFLFEVYREISIRRTPYLVILEEADKFIPQVGERLQILEEIARRGRKRGLGLILCTQRPSLVDKNVLSQCSNQLIGRLIIKNDLQSVSQFFPGHGLPKQLTALSPGIFYALGGLSTTPTLIQVRTRETTHGGITPRLKDHVVKPSTEFLAKFPSSKLQHGKVGLPVIIDSEKASIIAKKGKQFIFFGEEEKVANIQLIFRPLVEFSTRIRTGLFKKRFEERLSILDGVTGRQVELKEGLLFKQGIEKLLGIDMKHIELLKVLKLDRDYSLAEISRELGISDSFLRSKTKFLEERRLITSHKTGRIKVFRRMVELPKIQFVEEPLRLEQVNVSNAEIEEVNIKEAEVRDIIKGLYQGADVVTFKPFLYPLYKIELVRGKKKRIIWVDGRIGTAVEL